VYESFIISYEDALRNADSVNDLRLQIKLSSERGKNKNLAEGTEHFVVM
jgi:twitching motility protein PilU